MHTQIVENRMQVWNVKALHSSLKREEKKNNIKVLSFFLSFACPTYIHVNFKINSLINHLNSN